MVGSHLPARLAWKAANEVRAPPVQTDRGFLSVDLRAEVSRDIQRDRPLAKPDQDIVH